MTPLLLLLSSDPQEQEPNTRKPYELSILLTGEMNDPLVHSLGPGLEVRYRLNDLVAVSARGAGFNQRWVRQTELGTQLAFYATEEPDRQHLAFDGTAVLLFGIHPFTYTNDHWHLQAGVDVGGGVIHTLPVLLAKDAYTPAIQPGGAWIPTSAVAATTTARHSDGLGIQLSIQASQSLPQDSLGVYTSRLSLSAWAGVLFTPPIAAFQPDWR